MQSRNPFCSPGFTVQAGPGGLERCIAAWVHQVRYTPVLQYLSRRANILETCEPWEESWRPVSHGSCPGGLERCLGSCSLAPLSAFVKNTERSKMTPPTLLRSPFFASSSRPSSPVGKERLALLYQFFLIVFHDLITQPIQLAIPQFCSIFPAVRTSFPF